MCCLYCWIFSLIGLKAAFHVASHSHVCSVCVCVCLYVCTIQGEECTHRGASMFLQLESSFPANCSSLNVLSRCALWQRTHRLTKRHHIIAFNNINCTWHLMLNRKSDFPGSLHKHLLIEHMVIMPLSYGSMNRETCCKPLAWKCACLLN